MAAGTLFAPCRRQLPHRAHSAPCLTAPGRRTSYRLSNGARSHDSRGSLQPENLLLPSADDDCNIKITDFGFAKTSVQSDDLTTVLGTPQYVAPEMLAGDPYGRPADIWSIGVITFVLLCGYPPFHDDNRLAMFNVRASASPLCVRLLPRRRVAVCSVTCHNAAPRCSALPPPVVY
jgi:serine/threonine protein kinase